MSPQPRRCEPSAHEDRYLLGDHRQGQDSDAPEEILGEVLRTLDAEEIASFQEHFDSLFGEAYRWDLWGAAYLIGGGCSDDGFMDFRYALIAKGREVFEAALANPDSLADVDLESNESIGYVASEAYSEKADAEMPRSGPPHPSDPEGENWDFDDQEECERRLPRLWKEFSA